MSVWVEFFDTRDGDRMCAAMTIRFAVFVDEQGVPENEEIDDHDRTDAAALHALAYDGTLPVATGRFFLRQDGAAQIGRMAVMPDARGRGVGRMVLDALMAEARARGIARAVLFAQSHALAFYERAGFTAYGEPFLDAGIAHVAMERAL